MMPLLSCQAGLGLSNAAARLTQTQEQNARGALMRSESKSRPQNIYPLRLFTMSRIVEKYKKIRKINFYESRLRLAKARKPRPSRLSDW
jgi:hypothetical protein